MFIWTQLTRKWLPFVYIGLKKGYKSANVVEGKICSLACKKNAQCQARPERKTLPISGLPIYIHD